MSKDSSGKHCQNNKQRLQKKLLKDILNNKKIFQKMKNRSLLSIEKKFIK